jgi:predicted TIM-barrel fold metal-dependent hydrolase
VVERAGGYDRWRTISMAAIAGLDDAARARILGGNAERIYLGSRGRRGA